MGQNYLYNAEIAQRIVARAGVAAEDVVLEIGAGLGALTIPISQTAAKVMAVEKDRNLSKSLQTEFVAQGISNVVLLDDDMSQVNFQQMAQTAGRGLLVMGNLPYKLSSQILV
mgnify:CR=1 FL=1